jgi:hypothetical protein
VREYKIFAPAACIVSNTANNDYALRQIRTVLKGNVSLSTTLSFNATRRRKPSEGR